MKWLAALTIAVLLAASPNSLWMFSAASSQVFRCSSPVVHQVREKGSELALLSETLRRFVSLDGGDWILQKIAAALNP